MADNAWRPSFSGGDDAIYDFGDQIRRFARKADERVNSVIRKIIFDISTRLVLRSPVGDATYWKSPPPPGYVGGRFRANWQYGQGQINEYTTNNIDQQGSATIAKLQGAIPDEVVGDIHYITNSLPYAIRLEEGWSKRQAPNGMVRLTAIEFDSIVSAAADALE